MVCVFLATAGVVSNDLQGINHEQTAWRSWKCSRCGRFNLEGVGGCAYCGKPRKG